jgi:hypothetical protein
VNYLNAKIRRTARDCHGSVQDFDPWTSQMSRNQQVCQLWRRGLETSCREIRPSTNSSSSRWLRCCGACRSTRTLSPSSLRGPRSSTARTAKAATWKMFQLHVWQPELSTACKIL